MDVATLIAVLAGTFTMIAVMVSLFLWLRSEANSDRRFFQQVQSEDRKDLLQIARNMEFEMRDFHQRLLEVEKQRRGV